MYRKTVLGGKGLSLYRPTKFFQNAIGEIYNVSANYFNFRRAAEKVIRVKKYKALSYNKPRKKKEMENKKLVNIYIA